MGREDDTADRYAGVESTVATTTGDPPDWESVPADPDYAAVFGYETADWEQISATGESASVIFLPAEEDRLTDDAFIVADEDALCNLRYRK